MSQSSILSYFKEQRKRRADVDLKSDKQKVIKILDLDEVETKKSNVQAVIKKNPALAKRQHHGTGHKPEVSAAENSIPGPSTPANQNVPFQLKGSLSPLLKKKSIASVPKLVDENSSIVKGSEQFRNARRELGLLSPNKILSKISEKPTECVQEVKKQTVLTLENDLHLTPMKASAPSTPLKASSNLTEVKANSFLIQTELKANALLTPLKSAQSTPLKAGETVSVENTTSVNKVSRKSPIKDLIKSLPAYQRYASLVSPTKSSPIPLTSKKNVLLTPLKSQQATPVKASEILTPVKGATSSPSKSPLKSPVKSLIKGSPAYQRYSSLASPTKSSFILPYSYRNLAEIFRSVDAMVAMMYNRKETVTFRKLKPAVQEILRRNFTEKHLAQIKNVYHNAYSFQQEKCKSFGMAAAAEKYDLVITPILKPKTGSSADNADGNKEMVMTPGCLVERGQNFYRHLLEITKDHHEKFLQTLDPPLIVPREKITRWHPEFPVDKVPEIIPEELPQPPNTNHTSAKDVLDRARNLFSCNPRLEKALENRSAATTLANVKSEPESSNSLLKGIPKALLEKIRARQAEKALEKMMRTPDQDKEATQFSRLPEIARILRNIYVTEKKGVLLMETALTKLGNSYRERLSNKELEEHVQLIIKSIPGWLSVHNVRGSNYLKLSRNGDMAKVTKRLEELAEQKQK